MLSASCYSTTLSQTVPIPDGGFKSCLVNDYPALIDGNEDLIIAQAENLTGELKCVNRGIINISGIEYFNNISILGLDNNDIVNVTGIAGLTNLQEIHLNSNELEIVPSLSGFSSLMAFYANYNQLDNAPIFPISIKEIYLGNNSLSGTMDVSGLVEVSKLYVFENDIQELFGLQDLIALEELDAHTNELKQSKDLTGLIKLKKVNLEENEYENLPDFNLSSLIKVHVGLNMLTFEDFQPFLTEPIFPDSFPNFTSQLSQENTQLDTVIESSSWSWVLGFDQKITTNTYQWFLDGQLVYSTTVGELLINDVELADSGFYHCEVINSNPKLAGMKIVTLKHQLLVTPKPPCFSIQDIEIVKDIPSCQTIANIRLDVTLLGDTYGEISYQLESGQTNFVSTTGDFELNREGEYLISVNDGVCDESWLVPLIVKFDFDNCEPLSFSPNNDGIDDQIYIDGQGEAMIYDKSGQLIKSLNLPSYWDGLTNNKTQAITGNYVIIIGDEKSINIALIR